MDGLVSRTIMARFLKFPESLPAQCQSRNPTSRIDQRPNLVRPVVDDSQPDPAQTASDREEQSLLQFNVSLEKPAFQIYQSEIRWAYPGTPALYRLVLARGVPGDKRYSGSGASNRRRIRAYLKSNVRLVDRRRRRHSGYSRKLPERPEQRDQPPEPPLQSLCP
jgi:hypothetical protein